MPTYEYECSNCAATHEVVQKMSDPTLTECPVCGHAPIRKLFTGVGVVFKGSGFYRTDSRGSGDGSSGSSSSSGSTGSSDSTSSTKTSSTKTSSDSTSSGSGSSAAPKSAPASAPASSPSSSSSTA